MKSGRVKWIVVAICMLIIAGCRQHPYEDKLREVDRALENSDIYQENVAWRLDSLARSFNAGMTVHDSIEKLIEISDAYLYFDLEKSLQYLSMARSIVNSEPVEREDSVKTLLRLASLFNTEGMMIKEASDIWEDLEGKCMSRDNKLNYYILGVQVNNALAERAFLPELKYKYQNLASSYRDSVLLLSPENYIIAGNRLREKGRMEEAKELVKSNSPSLEGDRKGPYYHYLAGIYRDLEVPDSQLYFLAIAAEDDLRNGVREYIALRELAELLEPSDLTRAQAYIEQSRNDAIASHSSLRRREVGPIYSVITKSYNEKARRLTGAVIVISISMGVILVVILITLMALKRKNALLKERGEELQKSGEIIEKTNETLEKTNRRLQEESRVKSQYINSFMELCLSYLGKMESFRAKLGKIAAEGDMKKVTKAINSSRYVNREISEFYSSFDNAFFSLYPDFISKLNSLLRPEERYEDEKNLTTELRVYALIWLGIESSGEIARFLRCSESTVYNYRSMMRNRALERNSFEHKFIEISGNNHS